MDQENLETPYAGPAAGWGALKHSLKHLAQEKALLSGAQALWRMNKPGGFDCPGCAWPEPGKVSHAEFCENGAKAIAAETTRKTVTRDFFGEHTVEELSTWEHYGLEQQGRLAEPMRYDAASDRYVPISWSDAFATVGKHIRSLANPDELVLYTSGRTSNEAAFLYQLFGRLVGTNNFPDCSNMCHESSGAAMGESVGIGKGTVSLEDFEAAEAIFIFGQNPGTNHPRMLSELQRAAKRGCKIVSVNPLIERGLQEFLHPQDVLGMALNRSSAISSLYLQPLVGGDLAVIKGLIKCVLERASEKGVEKDGKSGAILDTEFIAKHTSGYEEMREDILSTSWSRIENQSGLSRAQIQEAAEIYMTSRKTIACWAMGLTQNKHAVLTIQYLINLMLLKGNIGRPGAGLCPVRGHSNVQGDRTVGITEHPKAEFLEALGKTFSFTPPTHSGMDTVSAIEAMHAGKVGVFIGMGGNFAAATPDTAVSEEALRRVGLTVQISTKLNRSHVVHGKEALILPCLGRTEIDMQAGKPQKVTVEDSMSMVHASQGTNAPVTAHILSEPAIVTGMAMAALPDSQVDWEGMRADYGKIRDKIAAVFPDFGDFNRKIEKPGGFHLRNSAREREWRTATGKARFVTGPLADLTVPPGYLRLMTLRSHDQYNTTIYGLDDRYRGIKGERRVVFIHPDDMREFKVDKGERVNLVSLDEGGRERIAEGFLVVPYLLPRGCAATYFPEANVLVPLDSIANKSRTPNSKFIVATIRKLPKTSDI